MMLVLVVVVKNLNNVTENNLLNNNWNESVPIIIGADFFVHSYGVEN